jgi:hypothetical protein
VNLQGAIRAQLPRAAEVMAGLSADQVNWRPAEGTWSVGECIAHLNTVNRLYAASIEVALQDSANRSLTSDGGEAKLGLFESWFIRVIEPPYRFKFKAPQKFRPAASRLSHEELLSDWVSSHDRLAQLAADSQQFDLKRVKVKSPATSLFKPTLLCALMIGPAHDRRHLWQAERIRHLVLTHSTRSEE